MLAVRSKGVTMNMATTSRQKGMMNVRGGDYSVMNGIHPYGNHKTLVILAEFQDVRYSISSPKESFSDMLNTPGYSENGATRQCRPIILKTIPAVSFLRNSLL